MDLFALKTFLKRLNFNRANDGLKKSVKCVVTQAARTNEHAYQRNRRNTLLAFSTAVASILCQEKRTSMHLISSMPSVSTLAIIGVHAFGNKFVSERRYFMNIFGKCRNADRSISFCCADARTLSHDLMGKCLQTFPHYNQNNT